jgi:hypothetical protein
LTFRDWILSGFPGPSIPLLPSCGCCQLPVINLICLFRSMAWAKTLGRAAPEIR